MYALCVYTYFRVVIVIITAIVHQRYRSQLHRGSLAEDVLVSELEKKPLSQLALNTKLPTPTEENAELAQKKDSPTMNESPKV